MASKKSADQDPRILWAMERTFLAWLRTGLALMGFGFVVARFSFFMRTLQSNETANAPLHGWSLWFGILLIFLGVGVLVSSVCEYWIFLQRFKRGEASLVKPSYFGMALAFGLILVGLVMAFYLLLQN